MASLPNCMFHTSRNVLLLLVQFAGAAEERNFNTYCCLPQQRCLSAFSLRLPKSKLNRYVQTLTSLVPSLSSRVLANPHDRLNLFRHYWLGTREILTAGPWNRYSSELAFNTLFSTVCYDTALASGIMPCCGIYTCRTPYPSDQRW